MKRPAVIVVPDYAGLSRTAGGEVDGAVRAHPSIVLALPTGATPEGMYGALAVLHRERGTDWSQVTTFNLDEYCDVAPEDPQSYAAYMRRALFGVVNLRPARCHLPDGLAPDAAAEARRYEAAIDAAGGIDLAVLGVGTNGHIGFNEPAGALRAETHVAELAEETWRRNFPDLAEADDPALRRRYRLAFTMGIGTILQARRILLLASGAEKREALDAALNGPITPDNPVSLLRLHREVTLVVDEEAGAGLQPPPGP